VIGAALALAVAVLVAPAGSRWRARAVLNSGPRRLRVPGPVYAAVGCAALSTVLSPTAVIACSLLAATVSMRRRTTRRRRIRTETAVSLQGALDVLVGELRVGAHPVAAVSAAAQESDPRTARPLGAVAARALLGADVAAGLRAEGSRSLLPGHWERLAVCWHLAQAHGLAIAALMQAAQRDIAERERFSGRVEAGMAGARATATILAGLPALGILLGHAIGAHPLPFLLSGGAGGWLLVVGTAFVCCGLLWSDRITSRVLT
jgi:tight adherence protein B